MKIMRESRKHARHHGEPVILFAVGEHTFAAPANEVDEIRDLQGLLSISNATQRTSVSKVKSILERSNKTYYVVDAGQHLGQLPSSKASRLMVLRSHPVAVLVDSIDRMAEIQNVLPLPRAFSGKERSWYVGLALMGESVVPVVSMSAFLSPAEQVVAKSVAGRRIAKGVTA
jgi:chemotaxis signal transduction protein